MADCPKCKAHPIYGDIWAETDQLYMEFDAVVYQYTLFTSYWCKRCDYVEEKEHDPELIHKGEVNETS